MFLFLFIILVEYIFRPVDDSREVYCFTAVLSSLFFTGRLLSQTTERPRENVRGWFLSQTRKTDSTILPISPLIFITVKST